MTDKAAARARLIAGGLLWLTSAQFFIAQFVVQQGWKGSRPYSLTGSWISDLGATTCGTYRGGSGTIVCSPRHLLLNIGLVVLAVQVAGGALLLRRLLPPSRWTDPAVALLVVAGLALPFVALFPEDTGKPWHTIAAILHLATAGLGTLATGLVLRSSGLSRTAALALILGTASVIGTLLIGVGSGAGIGRAAVERLAAWPFTAWTTLAGAQVLLLARRHKTSSLTRPKLRVGADCPRELG